MSRQFVGLPTLELMTKDSVNEQSLSSLMKAKKLLMVFLVIKKQTFFIFAMRLKVLLVNIQNYVPLDSLKHRKVKKSLAS